MSILFLDPDLKMNTVYKIVYRLVVNFIALYFVRGWRFLTLAELENLKKAIEICFFVLDNWYIKKGFLNTYTLYNILYIKVLFEKQIFVHTKKMSTRCTVFF